MPDIKEQLVELLQEYGQARSEVYIDIEADRLADFLLARGVTITVEA